MLGVLGVVIVVFVGFAYLCFSVWLFWLLCYRFWLVILKCLVIGCFVDLVVGLVGSGLSNFVL